MKNQLKIMAFVIMLITLSTQFSTAQISCTHQINNNTTCTWVVNVAFYNGSCNTPCQTYTGLSIGPNSNINPTCGTCNGTLCNVVVTWVTAGTFPVSGLIGYVDVNNISDSGTTLCSTGNFSADWTVNGTNINP